MEAESYSKDILKCAASDFMSASVLVAELGSGSGLHQPAVRAGSHLGSGHRHGLQVSAEGKMSLLNGDEAFSVSCVWRDMSATLPRSVISMSVLYVLTLHHRGDVIDKDGYGAGRR